MGLSPLARGNRMAVADVEVVMGPIPARAGEPFMLTWFYWSYGAYPRSRGGTGIVKHDSNVF